MQTNGDLVHRSADQNVRMQLLPNRRAIAAVVVGVHLVVSNAASAAVDAIRLGLPIPAWAADRSIAPQKATLGQELFFDAELSQDGTISCASCHRPELAFSDGRALAKGVRGLISTRNTPSLINAAFNDSQFWDGRRETLEEQAADPFLNAREHGLTDTEDLLARVRANPKYGPLFQSAFQIDVEDIKVAHVTAALAAFERTLISGSSPFDRFYYGLESSALSASAKRGLELFSGAARCNTCHLIGAESALLSDGRFHSLNVGLQKIAPRLAQLTVRVVRSRESGETLDSAVLSEEDLSELGRFVVTLTPSDIGKFRTPSLRNVALTSPYMHDGSVPSLELAVERELYDRSSAQGRALVLTPAEKKDLVEFLRALNSAPVLLPPIHKSK